MAEPSPSAARGSLPLTRGDAGGRSSSPSPGVVTAEDLIARVFRARDAAHLEHWQAKGAGSYARHEALGAFYTDVIGALDAFVEAHQAMTTLVGDLPDAPSESTALETLASDFDWIDDHYDHLTGGSRALGNLLDGVSAVYLSAIYKLRFLK